MNRNDFVERIPAPSVRVQSPLHLVGVSVVGVIADDLPCPWCGEATHEADDSCRGCGRHFG